MGTMRLESLLLTALLVAAFATCVALLRPETTDAVLTYFGVL